MDEQSRQLFFSSQNQLPPLNFGYSTPSLSNIPLQIPTTAGPSNNQQAWATSGSQDELTQLQQYTLPQEKKGGMDTGSEDGMASTSDFVKKLYKMLEDPSFQHVVSWGPHGDCFVVKDMNEFTKSILPRLFKHSNFASFVRQLNKYDFHKVKNTDEGYGEHSWTFRHPDFRADRRDTLENIKRKVPSVRKTGASTTTQPLGSSSSNYPPTPPSYQVDAMQSQLEQLNRAQEEMSAHVRNLERNYHDVLVEMVGFQRNMAQQDGLMQNLIQYFLQVEEGKRKRTRPLPPALASLASGSMTNGISPSPSSSNIVSPLPSSSLTTPPISTSTRDNPFFPPSSSSNDFDNNDDNPFLRSTRREDVAAASLSQMNEISRRAEVAGMIFGANAAVAAPGYAPSSSGGNDSGSGFSQERPPSRIWAAAANAGLINPDGSLTQAGATLPSSSTFNNSAMEASPKITSRSEALQRIEELQRNRPSSMGMLNSTAAKIGAALNGSMMNTPREESPDEDEEQVMPSNNSDGASAPITPPTLSTPSTDPWSLISPNTTDHEGLAVYTVGHLMPKSSVDDANGNWSFDPDTLLSSSTQSLGNFTDTSIPSFDSSASSSNAAASTSSMGSKTLRVRRSTYVPGWAVPPRVLLVDDDAVSRKLSSKFLQVFGCAIDVAVDGVGAVNKMNLEKYDLVLMDIVMPKLDGVSATSLIRKFDPMTPIISMTSNSKPNEIMTYYSSGMNDILPKPFTKQGLLDMLEKHLIHLKVIQQMSRIPQSVGIPPLSDASFEQALMSSSSAPTTGSYDEHGRINPLAGMGLSDEQYNMILNNIVNGEPLMGVGTDGMTLKRERDDSEDSRDSSKRSRFEVVE